MNRQKSRTGIVGVGKIRLEFECVEALGEFVGSRLELAHRVDGILLRSELEEHIEILQLLLESYYLIEDILLDFKLFED